MRVMKMCKTCRSLDWTELNGIEYCSACETSDCCAHREWVPVEDNEIEKVNIGGRIIRFYGGDLESLGVE